MRKRVMMEKRYRDDKQELHLLKVIHTENAAEAIGPYSHAIDAGDFIYVSEHIPVDPQSGEIVSGIENQTKQVMENIKAVLTEAGVEFSQAVKFTIYLSSMDNFTVVNDMYGRYLSEPYPARATVEVSRLPKDVLV